LTDTLGSTLALTDSTGTVQTSYSFEPFGNTTTSGSANTNSFAYTGRELDAGNLYFYRARYYNPQFGRFISEDPKRFGSGDKNFYAYVFNSPIDRADPMGRKSFKCRRNCAADFAQQYSLAGVLGIENPIGKAFLGNTFSGINDAINHFDEGPVALAGDLALSGLRQGIPGGGLASKGIVGTVTDGVVNAFGNAITGAGSETLSLNIAAGSSTGSTLLAQEGATAGLDVLDLSSTAAEAGAEGLAGPVALAKLGIDLAIIGIGLYTCW